MLPCIECRTLALVIMLSGTPNPFATLLALMTFSRLGSPLCLDVGFSETLKRTLLHSRYT